VIKQKRLKKEIKGLFSRMCNERMRGERERKGRKARESSQIKE
jgi:hypothetical protein